MNTLIGRPSVALAAAVLTFTAGCGQPETSSRNEASQQASPAVPQPSPSGPRGEEETEISVGAPLDPGKHVGPDFAVPLTFEIAEDGWETINYNEEIVGLWNERYEGEITISVIGKVFSPKDPEKLVKAPNDIVAWIRSHPHLEVLDQRAATLGNIKGTQVEVKATKTFAAPACFRKCVPLWQPEDYPYAHDARSRPRAFAFFELDGTKIGLTSGGVRAGFDEKAGRILRTVRFEAS